MAISQKYSRTLDKTKHEATSVIRATLNHKTLFEERFYHADLNEKEIESDFRDAAWELSGKDPNADIDVKVSNWRHFTSDYWGATPYDEDLTNLSKMGW